MPRRRPGVPGPNATARRARLVKPGGDTADENREPGKSFRDFQHGVDSKLCSGVAAG